MNEDLKELKYDLLLEITTQIVFFLNPEGIVVDVNDFIEKSLGFSPNEILGKHLKDLPFFSEEGLQVALENFEKRISRHGVDFFELELFSKQKKPKYFRVVGSLLEKEGTILGDLVICTDISDYKMQLSIIEENIKKLKERNGELEKMNELMVSRELKMIELKKSLKSQK